MDIDRKQSPGRDMVPGLRAFALVLLCCISTGGWAASVTIENGTELYTVAADDMIGNYFAVAGNTGHSSPGQVLEVLGGSIAGNPGAPESLQNKGSEDGEHTLSVGQLRSVLDAGGITSTSSLVFGFGLNESGAPGSNSVTITALDMFFELPDGGSQAFSLGGDQVQVFNYIQGQSTAEARFQLEFPFDFMAAYSNTSTEAFTISSVIDNTSAGFEVYFLSASITSMPPVQGLLAVDSVPVPAAVWLFVSGLFGLAGIARRK